LTSAADSLSLAGRLIDKFSPPAIE